MTDYGKLKLILGPMFSGKTLELIRLFKRNLLAEQKSVMIKYCKDTRYSQNYVVSHEGSKVEALSCAKLFNVDLPSDLKAIFIDEIQFYSDGYDFCYQMLQKGINVIASGLNGNYLRKPMANVSELISLAHNVTFLRAICHYCKCDDACYTIRTSVEGGEVLIAGNDKYRACCGNCYYNYNKHSD
jgi:thymidine kinase